MSDRWEINDGAIVERPREIRQYPLLTEIYDRHDGIISKYVDGPALEVAFGTHPHPDATVGVEAYAENNYRSDLMTVTGDARRLPFADARFGTVIGRRFLHHVPPADRESIVAEMWRVTEPGGQVVILEGTPGLYRRAVKRVAFELGVLGEDNDEYGHLSQDEIRTLVADNSFRVEKVRSLGSPFMPFSILRADLVRNLIGLYQRTQVVRWWTLVVGRKPAE